MMKRFLMLISIGLILSVSLTFAGGGGQKQGSSGRTTIRVSGMGMGDDDQYLTSNDFPTTWDPGQKALKLRARTERELILQKYPQYDWDWSGAGGWAENLDAKQRAMVASGTAPDVMIGEGFMSDYAEAGLLQEIPARVLEGVNPNFVLRGSNGKPYAISQDIGLFMLFYNKDLLTRAGLDPNKPPTTWDEWKQMARTITEKGNGQYWGGGIPSFPHDGGAFRATPFFRQLGTDIGKNGVPNMNDPKVQQTLQFIREMNAYFPPGLANANEEDPLWDAFSKEGQQNIAFVVDGFWREAASAARMNLGYAPLPLPPGGVSGNCLVGLTYFGIRTGVSQEVTDVLWDVIKNIILTEQISRYNIDNGRLPAVQSLLQNASLFKGALAVGREAALTGTYTGLYAFPKNSSQAREVFNQQVLARTTMTNDPIATICSQAQARMEALVK